MNRVSLYRNLLMSIVNFYCEIIGISFFKLKFSSKNPIQSIDSVGVRIYTYQK